MTPDDFRSLISVMTRIPADQIDKESSFRDDLGMDSLQLVNLVATIIDQYEVEFPPIHHMEDIWTVGSMYSHFVKEIIFE